MKTKHHFLGLLLLLSLCAFAACTAATPEESLASATEAETSSVTAIETQTDLPTEAFLETQASPVETPNATETEEITAPVTDVPLRSSDFTTELYSVTKIEGVCYLNFHDGNQFTPTGDENSDYVFAGVYYDSYEELRDTFLNGKLTTESINTIKQQFAQSDHGIAIPDIVNIGRPIVPSDCYISEKVCWTGSKITYDIDSDLYGGVGWLSIMTDAMYQSQFDENYTNALKNRTIISTTQGTYEGIPCTIYETTTTQAKLRDILLEAEYNGQSFFIRFMYVLDHYDDKLNESETVPLTVYIFSKSNDQSYMLQLHYFENSPTLDWLTSFVLAPVSDESSATS